ncbi:MAG: hypothetical protein IPN38_07035 [Flavobacteriales bacterium]|nr:hypothetical protein [Flavobacteriales bacterium]
MTPDKPLFPLVILSAALLLGGCDPMKQILVENRTSAPVTVVLVSSGPSGIDTSSQSLNPGEERNILLHFGKWGRPSMMRDQEGRVIGAAFDDDDDLSAVWVANTSGALRVKRRYLLNNGLVVRVR